MAIAVTVALTVSVRCVAAAELGAIPARHNTALSPRLDSLVADGRSVGGGEAGCRMSVELTALTPKRPGVGRATSEE